MRTDEIILDELDILINKPGKPSLDPQPTRTLGMDPRIIKDMVADHLSALKNINKGLPSSGSLEAALLKLEDEYMRMFGQRLTELLNAPESQVKAAVLELRRSLNNLASDSDADIGYDSIDQLMTRICDDHGCAPNKLHDQFVSTFKQTPDQYAKDQRDEKNGDR